MRKYNNQNKIIYDYILQRTNLSEIDVDTNLFETKIINSLMLIELLIFLQNSFDIKTSSLRMNINNFSTLRRIYYFVENNRNKI